MIFFFCSKVLEGNTLFKLFNAILFLNENFPYIYNNTPPINEENLMPIKLLNL